jgi:hypothetical protein
MQNLMALGVVLLMYGASLYLVIKTRKWKEGMEGHLEGIKLEEAASPEVSQLVGSSPQTIIIKTITVGNRKGAT